VQTKTWTTTAQGFHLALPKSAPSPRTSYAHLRSPLPAASRRRYDSVSRATPFAPPPMRIAGYSDPSRACSTDSEMVPSEHDSERDFVIKIRVETSAAAAQMTEDSDVPRWPATSPKRFRAHRMPRREVLRPVENELRTAGNATRRGHRMRFTRGVERPQLHWHFGQKWIRDPTAVPLARSEKLAVAQSIQPPSSLCNKAAYP
jgi:hypothetical protein